MGLLKIFLVLCLIGLLDTFILGPPSMSPTTHSLVHPVLSQIVM